MPSPIESLMMGTECPTIYSIGYGGRTVEQVLDLFVENGIECLVDVRSQPYSRFAPDFSREPLQAAVERRGLRYVFLGRELGGRPEAEDCYVDGKVDYDRLRIRPEYLQGIERLERARAQGMTVAMMCSELRPEECHRSKLIGATLAEHGIPVAHIDETGALVGQDQVIARLTGSQLGLFGDPAFTSRKRYK